MRQELASWKMEGHDRRLKPREMVKMVVDFENASWFANLNTPEEFAEAEKHLDALDT